ncbi:hypothetical protein ACH5RR_023871 [Cinchona calisaya]|uniref:Uncharacterized protein n=1 Tax=Cinchona calisaya TaxID=153742 RepID=A0ABD2ZDA9_9GENT
MVVSSASGTVISRQPVTVEPFSGSLDKEARLVHRKRKAPVSISTPEKRVKVATSEPLVELFGLLEPDKDQPSMHKAESSRIKGQVGITKVIDDKVCDLKKSIDYFLAAFLLKDITFVESVNKFLAYKALKDDLEKFCKFSAKVGFDKALADIQARFSTLDFENNSFFYFSKEEEVEKESEEEEGQDDDTEALDHEKNISELLVFAEN